MDKKFECYTAVPAHWPDLGVLAMTIAECVVENGGGAILPELEQVREALAVGAEVRFVKITYEFIPDAEQEK